eukprot:354857-Chlamydomonas_euryale.AAC.24
MSCQCNDVEKYERCVNIFGKQCGKHVQKATHNCMQCKPSTLQFMACNQQRGFPADVSSSMHAYRTAMLLRCRPLCKLRQDDCCSSTGVVHAGCRRHLPDQRINPIIGTLKPMTAARNLLRRQPLLLLVLLEDVLVEAQGCANATRGRLPAAWPGARASVVRYQP